MVGSRTGRVGPGDPGRKIMQSDDPSDVWTATMTAILIERAAQKTAPNATVRPHVIPKATETTHASDRCYRARSGWRSIRSLPSHPGDTITTNHAAGGAPRLRTPAGKPSGTGGGPTERQQLTST
jgi:hypothetical protein